MKPLKTYWWNGQPNFGDVLSREIVGWVSGRDIRHTLPKRTELFAIGSIMQIVRRTHREARPDGSRPLVWGSGCLKPIETDFVRHVQIAALRGPISESLLGVSGVAYGDPGILVADAMPDRPERQDRIGLVPHLSQLDRDDLHALAAREPVLELIDVRDEPFDVCRRIAACKHVIASSLHGLVVADAFGIPNTWLLPDGNHVSPRLKFYDYAAGIERPLPRPVTVDDLSGRLASLPDGPLPYADGVDASKSALLGAFPDHLKERKAA